MGKSIGRMGLLLLAAASATAETQQTNVRTAGARFYFSRYDQFVGGKRISASVTIEPTWPPGSPPTIRYSADECTIDYCVEMWPGYVWCDCGPFSIVSAGGMGRVPDGAFDVSPQGVARLSLDTAGVTWDYAYGTCERLDVTWTERGVSLVGGQQAHGRDADRRLSRRGS